MLQPFAPPWLGFKDYQTSVPQLYWNVDSNEQRYHLLCKQLHKLICYADMLGVKLNITNEQVTTLEEEFEKFKESGFFDYYADQLAKWIEDNKAYIWQTVGKQVYFGLTDDGYFCAYVPDSWKEIIFDTGAVYGRGDYGRLVLRFDATGSGIITNTYDYSDAPNV